MDRRKAIRALVAVPVLVPMSVTHWLATRNTETMPTLREGDLLTADTLNAMITRINELSKKA